MACPALSVALDPPIPIIISSAVLKRPTTMEAVLVAGPSRGTHKPIAIPCRLKIVVNMVQTGGRL